MKNIAVIGTGYWGKNLVRNYFELGALRVVCDLNANELARVAQAYPGLQTQTDFDKVLNDPEVEAVVVALPAALHHKYAKLALLANKDVYVEKPLALTREDGRELVQLADERKRILMVGHLLQYHPAFERLKEMVRKEELGKLQYIYSNRLSLGKIRREENSLWSFAPHDISMILALCNQVPTKVTATGASYLQKGIADVTTTHLEFASGVKAHIFVSWLHPFKEQKLVVVADQKMAVFEDSKPAGQKLAIYPCTIRWEEGTAIPEKSVVEYVEIEDFEPLRAECNHFIHCVSTRERPRTDGQEGFRVLDVLEKAQTALKDCEPMPEQDYFVHESAYIDQPCNIGKGTKIWHFSHVLKGATLGSNCNLGQNVSIAGGVTIGNNVKIQNNVSVYTGTRIEDDVFLGPSCVLTNVTNPRSEVNRQGLYEETKICKGATVGANSTIVCGIRVGRYSFIAAGALVAKDVPDYALMMGNPARQHGWMSRHGHRLTDKKEDGYYHCPESSLRYKETEDGLICVDLAEDQSLPSHLKVGTVSYDKLKERRLQCNSSI